METKNITKDSSISAVRLISTLFIVACHIMQFVNCELAWWFNVGVQIFLCISGYLYGSKNITNVPTYYYRTFRKILVGYYSVIIPVLYIHYFIVRDISFKQVMLTLIANQTVPGGEHLWFVPLILLCYIITPFLDQYFRPDSVFKLIVKLFFALFVVEVIFRFFITYFNPVWISCYVTGFFLNRISFDIKAKKAISKIVVALALLFNSIQILCSYILNIEFPLFVVFCNYAHLLLGAALFIVMKGFFAKADSENPVLRLSDKHSYYVYLSHQFFILGPLTIMNITPYLSVNIALVIIAIAIATICTYFISNFLDKSIDTISSYFGKIHR